MVRQLLHVRADDKQSGEQIPPLEPGDRLTRDKFERHYEAMPRGIKAELLEGVVPWFWRAQTMRRLWRACIPPDPRCPWRKSCISPILR
jgi:hypothetical protein